MKTLSQIRGVLIFLLSGVYVSLSAQAPPAIVNNSQGSCVNDNQQFYVANCPNCTNFVWNISGPHTQPQYSNEVVYGFYWTATGTYQISCSFVNNEGPDFSASYIITITGAVTPEVNISRSPTTDPIPYGTPVTFTASPTNGGDTPGYQWFLNNVAQNGETGSQYENSILQNNDQVFVRMYSSAGCPSPAYDDSNVITMNVTYPISAPPTVTNRTITYNTSTSLQVSHPNFQTGDAFRWYDFPTGGSILYEGTEYFLDPLLDHKTYYVSLWKVGGAESPRSVQTVTLVVPSPDIPSSSINTCGAKILTRGTPPANVTWYWQGTNAGGESVASNAATYSVEEANGQTYYLRAKAATANIWSSASGVNVTTNPVDITVNNQQPAQTTIVQATHSVRLSPGFKNTHGVPFRGRIAITPECNDVYNWSEEILYDQGGQPMARSRIYVTGLGQEMQSQSIDYLTGKVWASQPLYDNFNNPAAATMPAPILESDFILKKKFVTSAATGQAYAASDFDNTTTLNNPNAVSAQPGTVGWYYSSNNNMEPQTPVTSYPYFRGYTPAGPDPTTSTSASPGDQHKMGSGHEVRSERQMIGAGDLKHYFNLRHHFVNSSLPVTGYKFLTTDPDGKKIVSFVDADGRALASATYNGAYDNWSYSYYNDLGQLVASVAPKGVVITDPDDPNPPYPGYVTLYKYDHLGRLIETSSPDEGTSRFVYSTDGKIRFSENEEQRTHPGCPECPKRFSYTNYDYLGRLIESGEYTSSVGGYIFEPHTASASSNSILLQVDYVGQAQGVTRKIPGQATYISDSTFIEYDYQATDLPNVAPYNAQSNTIGQVTKTKNAFAKTWYSYDEFGQLLWTMQWIEGLADYKTIDYTYDYFGNVTQVAYQKSNTAEDFYHYYEYDKNQRLTKVFTSKDAGVTKTLQAAYYYYLHGALKRMELGGNLQGVDYVYNIDGSLKLINHPDPALDPGADGIGGSHAGFMKDVFGEALDYYTNDYTGAGYNEGNVTLAAPYTDKFGGTVKAIRWHSHTDSHVPRAYAFTYDALNQMDNADWGSVTGNQGNGYGVSIDVHQAYKEDIGSYDKNGNIMNLVRKGKTGNNIANYAYNYDANTNKLSQVTTGGDNLNYQYNAIGQMTRQMEGSNTMKVKYNAYGLVKEITNSADKLLLTYKYDDRGNRLVKTQYDPTPVNNPEIKSTYYVYDAGGNVLATYEKIAGNTQLIEVPIYAAGRIGIYKPGAATTFYEVADHLGNVRGVIGVSETDVYSANFESPTNSSFQHYTTHDDDLMDHTDAGTVYHYSQILTGGYNTQVGLAKSIKVSPGDKIKIEVYGKYRNLTTTDVSLNTFAATLTGAFGLTAGAPGDPGLAYEALEDYGTLIAGSLDHSENALAPKAYLNILLFDNNYDLVDAAYKQVLDAQQVSTTVKAAHDYMVREVTIKEPGYAYIFLSNENLKQVDVHFDDVTITHVHSPVVAGGDYYPFGLVMEEREVTDEGYRYGYQGQFSEKDLTTGMQEFELRMYDPRIGRWLSPDPYGQYASPYLAMGNTPHINIDADGGFSTLPTVTITATSYATIAGFAVSAVSAATSAVFRSGCPPLCAQGTRPEVGITGGIQYNGYQEFFSSDLSSVLPVDTSPLTASNLSYLDGLPDGIVGGAKSTGEFVKGVVTFNGSTWRSIGRTIFIPSFVYDLVQTGSFVADFVQNTDLTGYKGGYATGFLIEKGAEFALLRRASGLSIKPLRASGGPINGFTISRGAGYGAKPRFDVHPLMHPSRRSFVLTLPQGLKNGKIPIPHYHRGSGNALRIHRPWEANPVIKSPWKRFLKRF